MKSNTNKRNKIFISTHILRTRPLHDHLLKQVASEALLLKNSGKVPHMAVVLVGENPASKVYVAKKKEACEKNGIAFTLVHLNAEIDDVLLQNEIQALNNREDITGIIIQLPLPAHLDRLTALDTINSAKDVDGLGPTNSGRASLGLFSKTIYPATPLGIMRILDWVGFNAKGKDAVVVGRSNLVGRPTADLLGAREATVMVCHKETKDLTRFTKKADLIVVATGVPHLLHGEDIKEGAVVIDVGISPNPNGEKTIVGDVDTASCLGKASIITPVPGGVGPMTVASLLTNVVDATRLQNGLSKVEWDVKSLPWQ